MFNRQEIRLWVNGRNSEGKVFFYEIEKTEIRFYKNEDSSKIKFSIGIKKGNFVQEWSNLQDSRKHNKWKHAAFVAINEGKIQELEYLKHSIETEQEPVHDIGMKFS